ncbi:hypothetical protein FA13DRAFT_1712685 [Coprinellus micaceus]|uniref:Uncharacterized protein n=1 Tax=Coprinellus micaceus TaxID=71717 RepID=A0A4Y7SZP8_COPMI|nr:hypothetical protein FA13DRAFT_1712685 [Coprinellus micaceus]
MALKADPTTQPEPAQIPNMDGPPTFAASLDLTVLAEYPWLCAVPAHRKVDVASGSHYIPFLQSINERIIASEHRALSGAPPGTSVPLLDPIGLTQVIIPGHGLLQSLVARKANPQQSSSQLSGATFSSKISHLASILLHYKLFDVVTAISSPDLIRNCSGQPYKYLIPDPGKIRYKIMSNWAQAVQHGLKAIRETSYFENTPHQHGTSAGQFPSSQAGVTDCLFSSLSRRMQEADGHSILSNFECAALYMRILFRMEDPGADIPSTANELRLFLNSRSTSFCQLNDRTDDGNRDAFLEKIEKPQSFKLPLHFALAVSPVCLFLPTQLMRKDVGRLNLLLMWQGLGGSRPPSLLGVEVKIYRALVDVALGICMPLERFKQMFNELAGSGYEEIPFNETAWLAAREDSPFKLRVGPVNPQSPRYLGPDNTSAYQQPSLPAMNASASTSTSTSTNTSTIPQGHSNASFEPIRADDSILAVNTSVIGQQGGAIKRPSQDALPQRPTRRSRKGLDVVHDAVDLTAEREDIAVQAVELTDQPVKRYELRMCFGGPEEQSCCVWPTFYSTSEKDRFQMLWNLGQQFLRNHAPIRRCIQFVESKDLLAWSSSLGQATLRGKINVVVYGLPLVLQGGSSILDQDTLQMITPSLRRIVKSYDFSLPMDNRETHVMLESFLKAVLPPAKVMRSAQFPISVTVLVPKIFGSDFMAWDATFNRPWCRRHEIPLNTLRFGCVATASSYEDFRVAVHGFGLYLEVRTGALWLLLGDRGEEESIVPREHSFHGGNVHYEPVRLEAGSGITIRPGTAVVWLALDHSVFVGSHWYASSTLTATAISIIQEFLGGTRAPSSSADMSSARLTLRRLVHFYYMVYTTGLFFSRRTSEECAHTPDVSTPEGLENLLSLCNLMELGNVLAGDGYTSWHGAISESERQDIIEARRLCRGMVDWVRRHFIIFDQATKQEQSLYDQVWMPYLARYIRIILESKGAEAKGRPPHSDDAQATISTLNASFSGAGSEILQGHISALDSALENSSSLDLLLPGFRSIRIQERDQPLPDDQSEPHLACHGTSRADKVPSGSRIDGKTVMDINYYRIRSGLTGPYL